MSPNISRTKMLADNSCSEPRAANKRLDRTWTPSVSFRFARSDDALRHDNVRLPNKISRAGTP
jgi:hypothetical protein